MPRLFNLLIAAVLAATLLFATPATAQEADAPADASAQLTDLPDLAKSLRDDLQSQRYEQAVKQIDALLAKPEVVAPDYLRYLKGRAQIELKQADEAIKTLTELEAEFPKSDWLSRSRFARADVFVRQRDYLSAGKIYQAEAERLLSTGRQDELAAVYLEFADRYFEGVPADDPVKFKNPDYEQALAYYREARKLQASVPIERKIHLRIAISLQELGQPGEAIQEYRAFLQDDELKDAVTPQTVEVRFRLGQSHLAHGQPAQARQAWQDLLQKTDPTENEAAKDDAQSEETVADFRARAAFQLAHTYGLPSPNSPRNLELGVTLAERFLEQYPDHKLAPQAAFEIAQAYLNQGRLDEAVERLKSFIANPKYAEAEQLADARRLLGNSLLRQKKYDAAITAWKEFLEKHPTDAQWSDVQRQVIGAEYAQAEEQRRLENYDKARELWTTFLNKYPLDERAPTILFEFGRMKRDEAIAKKCDEELTDECKQLFEAAIVDWRRLVAKYPNTEPASTAALAIGVTLEVYLGRLPEALEAYRKVAGSAQDEAQQRIEALTSPKLVVRTERKFRSDEQPQVHIATRNIETLTVKMHRIDMADYFRKMHLATGVETLDIALIDADKSWGHDVKEYEEYRQLDQDIDIPLEGPGVVAITVSSEKLEATTMVIVSDIDVIVKSSRNELFVFAENMRTGQPVEGVSVLVSDGGEIFAEEQTAAGGILQKTYEELKSIEDLRVFAIHEGHSASTVTNLNGLDFAVGLSAKGYLFTDRPAYRPGGLINIKGIVRWVDNDRYTFKPGTECQLEVHDAQGRQIHQRKLALSKFGTIADNLLLPEEAPQGGYRIHLHRPGTSESYETTVQVQDYQLQPIELSVDLPKHVYYRGDKIEGTISLKYYYGTPLAKQTLRYRVQSQRSGEQGVVKELTTDEQGEAKFEIETDGYDESQQLALIIEYPDRGLTHQETLYLATVGFHIGITTQRSVYITGETFDATLLVTDPTGEPVATDLKLDVIEQTRVKGETGERLVSSFELKTDEEDGKARQTVNIEQPGRYLLRATGTDQFGNRVTGQRQVLISGEKDNVRLRILAEKHHYKMGDEATIKVHWREEPALALVTYEGAHILGHQLVQLKQGENDVKIPMSSELAPNFNLAVAVMQRERFHQANSPFAVSQRLNITLKTNADEVQPGGDLTVDIEVTDSQGQPVSAEIAMALVQQNLLAMFGDASATIEGFFGTDVRQPSLRARTSCTFSYEPNTHSISRFLLAEEDRKAVLKKEIAALGSLRRQLGRREMMLREKKSSDGQSTPMDPFGSVDAKNDDMLAFDKLTINGVQDFEALNSAILAETELSDLSGTMEGFDTTLSLEIRQTQQVHQYDAYGNEIFMDTDGAIMLGDGMYGGAGFGGGGGGGGFPVPAMQVGDGLVINAPVGGTAISGGAPMGQAGVRFSTGNFGRSTLGTPVRISGRRGQPSQPMMLGFEANVSGNVQNYFAWNESMAEGLGVDIKQAGNAADWGVTHWMYLANSTDAYGLVDNRLQANNGREGKELKGLIDAGLTMMPNLANAETAFWDPTIVTGDDGEAQIVIRMPDRSTAWTLSARGINEATQTGAATVDVVTKKDLFGEMTLPLAFVTGDRASIRVEIHNALEGEQAIAVQLTTTIGDHSVDKTQRVEMKGPGIEELLFPVEITEGRSVKFELKVSNQMRNDESRGDQSEQLVTILPDGLPVYATASGTAGQSTIVFVKFDPEIAAESQTLELLVGPSVDRSLLDAVIGGSNVPILLHCGVIANTLERPVSDVLGGVALLEMIGASRDAKTPDAVALSGRINSGLRQLITAQRDDGGWGWQSRTISGDSNSLLSSRVVWALASARQAGFAVPNDTMTKGTQYLKTAFTALDQSDREAQAVLLHGLATAGEADFAWANRLYRSRNSLSQAGLLHVALALIELNREPMANELLALVKLPGDWINPNLVKPTVDERVLPWMRSPVEQQALLLLALQKTNPADGRVSELSEALLSARVGVRWQPEKANGPALMALSQWHQRSKSAGEKQTLSVAVNDREIETFTIDPATDGTRRVAIPAEALIEGRPQRINIDVEGRGRFSYSAILSGFVPTAKIKPTTKQWSITRAYQPGKRLFEGHEMPRGFGILTGSYRSFNNPMTELPVGERTEVTLYPRRHVTTANRNDPHDYLVLTESIPAGCRLLKESISGHFERYEITAGAITFFLGDRTFPGDIHYTLVGTLPGEYHAVPSVLRSFYTPDLFAVAKPKSLTVLPKGAESADEYKLTPVEQYEFGQRLLANGKHAEAHEHLAALINSTEYQLKPDVYKNVVQMLFTTSLVANNTAEVVRYFEIIKEKFPDVEVSFERILKVAAAYRELGEYERSYLVYRATLEASFMKESQVVGFLDGQGEFVRSVQMMDDILRLYPAEAYVATATYALSQEIYGKAPEIADNEKLRDAGLTSVGLIATSIRILDHLLTNWPKDPEADQAAFALANALLDLEQYETAIARSRTFAERYPDSKLVDSFLYMIALSEFSLGHHEEALKTAKKVAETKHTDPQTGVETDSVNKWEAVYIMGQIYHSLGKAAQAIEEYARVDERFADAAEAIDYFKHQEIKLPEVTTLRPDEAKQVELDFRNLAEVSLKVYRIDLMKFGLMQRNLDRITAINLAGIKPYHESTVELGDGKDYRDREQTLRLPLEDEGAYLIVCRGDNLYASGLVLVTPLSLVVQEDTTSGRVRVTVKEGEEDKFVDDVHVKVIGSANSEFESGETDLRGLFVADGIEGTSTVIAMADADHYAFYRGERALGDVQVPKDDLKAAPNAPAKQSAKPQSGMKGEQDLLRQNLFKQNRDFNSLQRGNYRGILDNTGKGVKAKSAY